MNLASSTFTLSLTLLLLSIAPLVAPSDEQIPYDSSAYTECKKQPEEALYNGGVLKDLNHSSSEIESENGVYTPALILQNLTQGTIYCFSSWVKIEGGESALIRASLTTEQQAYNCIGTVLANSGCWSFLKGGFVLSSPSTLSTLVFQNSDGRDISIMIASTSLQPFTAEQWRNNQDNMIKMKRKRAVMIHVSDKTGERLQGAVITIKQVSRDFPFGSAIAKTIIGNIPYQKWFAKRFNTAVFENELKWYATEPKQHVTNYTTPDQMLHFVRSHQISVRGHNIFWEDPKYTPTWLLNLTDADLRSAVDSRIQSLMSKYKSQFMHWDVSNEMLHFDFYEDRLGPNATSHFYQKVHEWDPLATLFMNEFNVVETCSDVNSTVDGYVRRLKELEGGGVVMDGIGLEGHFLVPNVALMRAVLDKLGTLGLPIWLTEVDVSKRMSMGEQAIYLEQILREGFSHPSVNGIMLWSALHPNGCYQMCLTDNNFQNLPAGDVVDHLLQEWQNGEIDGQTDEYGSYSFDGFLGEYKVSVNYGNRTKKSTFSLSRGDETRHYNIQM